MKRSYASIAVSLMIAGLVIQACKMSPNPRRGGGNFASLSFKHYTARHDVLAVEKYRKEVLKPQNISSKTIHVSDVYKDKAAHSKGLKEVYVSFKRQGGTAEAAFDASHNSDLKGKRIGIMLAGNSGLPGGAVGRSSGSYGFKDRSSRDVVHPNHRTQEEDIVSDWLVTEKAIRKKSYQETFSLIDKMWGFKAQNATNTMTLQGMDYRNLSSATRGFRTAYSDVWVVKNALLSRKEVSASGKSYNTKKVFQADLFFVGGPNGNANRGPSSSTGRTLNKEAYDYVDQYPFSLSLGVEGSDGKWNEAKLYYVKNTAAGNRNIYPDSWKEEGSYKESASFVSQSNLYQSYKDFKDSSQKMLFHQMIEGIRGAVSSTLDAMVQEGVEMAYIAKVSTGIYSGLIPKELTVSNSGTCTRFVFSNGSSSQKPSHDYRAFLQRKFLESYFLEIVKDILEEVVGPNGEQRYRYFKKVAVVDVGV